MLPNLIMNSSQSNEGNQGAVEYATMSPPRPNFRRLTSRKHSKSPSTPQVEKTEASAPGTPTQEDRASASSSGIHRLPKVKLSALDRLKKIGSRKGKEKAVFSGFLPEDRGFAENHETSLRDTQAVPLTPQNAETSDSAAKDGDGETAEIDERDDPEVLSLAQRVQQLLSILTSSLPTQIQGLYSSSGPTSPSLTEVHQRSSTVDSASTTSGPAVSSDAEVEPNASSTPPPPTTGGLIQDKILVSLLSSTTVMNGSIARGKESVFALLDRLKRPLARSASTAEATDAKGKGKLKATDSDDAQEQASIEGSEDVMLYAPLEPRADSEVEIAESEILSMCGDAEEEEVMPPKPPEPTETVGDEKVKRDEKAEKKPIEKVIWVPSRTKISVQALWWGYRMFVHYSLLPNSLASNRPPRYLPPPVLMILNNKSIEAAKRAAIITTALKWLLDHLPLDVLPLQLRPAAALLRSLVPVIGYIGSFIGWSWSAVCSFDRGQGVVLSATWLLPIALIPGTWEENELPSGAQVISVNPAHPVSSVAGPSR